MIDSLRRRSADEIRSQILELSLKSTIQNHLLFQIRMSYSQLQRYLKELMKCGLLESHEGNWNDKDSSGTYLGRKAKRKYLTTECGELWLQKWKELQELGKEKG